MVMASFQQTLWAVQPVSSGAIKNKALCEDSFNFIPVITIFIFRAKSHAFCEQRTLFGGDVLRVLHGDECLTVSSRDEEEHVE